MPDYRLNITCWCCDNRFDVKLKERQLGLEVDFSCPNCEAENTVEVNLPGNRDLSARPVKVAWPDVDLPFYEPPLQSFAAPRLHDWRLTCPHCWAIADLCHICRLKANLKPQVKS